MRTLKLFVKLLLIFIWHIIFVYACIAFIKAEFNPFIWQVEARGTMVLFVLLYLPFLPLIVHCLEYNK